MSSRLRPPGWWLEVLGAAHVAVGAVLYRREITDAIQRGVDGSVDDHGPVATAWFHLVARATWSAGRLMRAPERGEPATAPLRTVGAKLAFTGAIGAVVMPRSPFGLLAAAGLAAVVASGSRAHS